MIAATDRPPFRIDVQRAHRTLRRFSLREAEATDLTADLNERMNMAARLQADLADGIFDDGDAEQLRGGIAYEEHRVEEIVSELERRERARAFGYRNLRSADEPNLPARFARIRASGAAELADLIGQETDQQGQRTGDRWRFRCPFHSDTTPSLVVFPDGRAHCFGCGWNGDAVDFIAEYRGTPLVSALRLLERGLA